MLQVWKNKKVKSNVYRLIAYLRGCYYVSSSTIINTNITFYIKTSKVKPYKCIVYSAILNHSLSAFRFETFEHFSKKKIFYKERTFIYIL
jgi:hypothetical protein